MINEIGLNEITEEADEKTNTKAPAYLLFILSLGYIMAVLDTTGVVLAVPHIETAMSVSLEQSIWIINAYTLALGSLLLLQEI